MLYQKDQKAWFGSRHHYKFPPNFDPRKYLKTGKLPSGSFRDNYTLRKPAPIALGMENS